MTLATSKGEVRRISLGYRPRKWQQECTDALKRFSVLVLHRRAGKTEIALRTLIHSATRNQKDLPFYAYIAPQLKQAKLIAWERLKQIVRLIPGTEINESELSVRFAHNKAKIQVLGADNPDALRGVRLDGVVIDEVAQCKPEVWTEIVQPALSDRRGWCAFLGTPKGVNLFSELYYRALELPDWCAKLYTVYDTDALDPEEVERLRRDMPENEFNREYLCDFSAAAENQLISLSDCESACRRVLREDAYNFAPKIMGVDVARFGDDRSVIALRQGLVLHSVDSYKGLDNMQFAGVVAAAAQTHNPDAIFVDTGYGTGVIDRLRSLGLRVIEVNFGGRADTEEFVNKRTEMWCKFAEWVRAGGVIPNRTSLKQDAAAPTYSFNAKNQRVLESKDEIKKRILRSPDEGDAVALTFAHPVAPRRTTLEAARHQARRRTADYNPLD